MIKFKTKSGDTFLLDKIKLTRLGKDKRLVSFPVHGYLIKKGKTKLNWGIWSLSGKKTAFTHRHDIIDFKIPEMYLKHLYNPINRG